MNRFLSVPHLNITVDENNLTVGALKVLEIIRPTWPKENIKFKAFTDLFTNRVAVTSVISVGYDIWLPRPENDGLTNKLVACKLMEATHKDTVLVRVYGNKTDLIIDRKAETRNILFLNGAGLAPKLYATFENGLAYQFISGTTLNEKTVTQPNIYKLVAVLMARMHQMKVLEQDSHPVLWDKMQKFLTLIPKRFTDSYKQKRFETTIVPKIKIQEEVIFLKEKLSKLNSPVVFSHNDLLPGNVIYTSEKHMVTFIDFEYSAFNYQAFDIANHFTEFVGTENVDYSKYPSKELQLNWLHAYLAALHNDEHVSEAEIQRLYVQVNQFVLAAHIFWGIWSLIQAENSHINFDFMGYAAIRFNEYFAKKDVLLALDLPR